MSNLLFSSCRSYFSRCANFSLSKIKFDRSLKVNLTGCPECQKPASFTSVQIIRTHKTRTEPEEHYKAPDSDISLEQGVRLSRQGCSETTKAQSIRKLRAKNREPRPGWILPEGHDTGIKVYNTVTRQKDPLMLPDGRMATWYTCGPTVYDNAHIGHASSYVRTDIIRRILQNNFNIDIVMVMGVTDIDDKIIRRAKKKKVPTGEMSRRYETLFFRDMESLDVMAPTVRTRVTEHIPHIIHFIQRIVDNNYAYKTPSGSVYFDVMSYGRYGRLWTHSLDTAIRDTVDREKRSARDFALWKAAKPDEPYWESPWGRGRPGWHIECSTMASTIFGEHLDIHSGGDDLIFPHHENEMAQSEACFCCPQWTNYWIHTGHLHLKNDKNKMSKSLNNTISVSDLLARYTPSQFRLFCMLRPYRSSVEYSEEAMVKAVRLLAGWSSFMSTADAYVRGQLTCQPINEPYLRECLEYAKQKIQLALADDFDTPKAVNAIEELVHKANVEMGRNLPSEQTGHMIGGRSPGVIAAISTYIDRIMDMWGIKVRSRKYVDSSETEQRLSDVMDSLVSFRGNVRNFALNANNILSKSDLTAEEISQMSAKERKQAARQKMAPLLDACDNLRNELKISGIRLQDHGKESSWDMETKQNNNSDESSNK